MTDQSPIADTEPPRDCPLCPRLVALREELRVEHPDWWNSPVRSFGDPRARIAIIGLAPGKHGANRTGRPFTGDFAGVLLYQTLLKFGLATGAYGADPADGLVLRGVRVTNAVRCVPPANLPTPLSYITALFEPWAALGVALLILWLMSRMTLLSWADLSYVLPVTSIGYVLVALAGRFLLNEQITERRWAGILLIVTGVTLVSFGTTPRTENGA